MNRKESFVICGVTLILSIFLYTINHRTWYGPAVIGVWLLFDNLSHLRGNKTTLDLLIKKQNHKFLILFIWLGISGFFIEFLGNFFLQWWRYNYFHILQILVGSPFGYPFILMSFREMYEFVDSYLGDRAFSIFFSMILGIIIWETPNFFSKDWIYTVSLISAKIFGINFIIFLGWTFLILIPVYIYQELNIKV